MARQWTDMLAHESIILEMRIKGLSRREIASRLGFSLKQIENFINRHNKRHSSNGIATKNRGRTRKYPLTPTETMSLRIKELEREVKILRSFLHAAGRM